MTPAGRACPPDVLDWIAWYPEGDLPDAVRAAVESHAAECVACRIEIDLVRGEAATFEAALPDADALFERILARLEEEAATGRAAPRSGRPLAPPRRRTDGARAAALAAGLAFVVGAAALGAWLGGVLTPPPVYETASAPAGAAVPGDAAGPVLDVVFRDDVPFARVAEALRASEARIVAGPGPGGRVRLQLPAGADAAAAARRLRGEDGVALFAEPAPGEGSAR